MNAPDALILPLLAAFSEEEQPKPGQQGVLPMAEWGNEQWIILGSVVGACIVLMIVVFLYERYSDKSTKGEGVFQAFKPTSPSSSAQGNNGPRA